MTSQNWLEQQHMHNQKFSDEILNLDPSDYKDWAITSLFYAALHLVHRHSLQHASYMPTSHSDRQQYVNKYLKTIRDDYWSLHVLSIQARYTVPYSGITTSHVQSAQYHFRRITSHMRSLNI